MTMHAIQTRVAVGLYRNGFSVVRLDNGVRGSESRYISAWSSDGKYEFMVRISLHGIRKQTIGKSRCIYNIRATHPREINPDKEVDNILQWYDKKIARRTTNE